MFYIFIILVCLGLFLPKLNIIEYCVIAFLSYLSLISTKIADFNSYQGIYYSISKEQLYQTGYGWYVLNSWGRNFNLTYEQFKASLTIISLLLIAVTVRYFLGKNTNYIWGLYLLYPALINIVQIRFFIALSLSIFSTIFLFKSRKKIRYLVLYIICLLLAVSIHSSCVFYFVFLFIPIIEKNEKIFSYLCIVISLGLIPFQSFLRQAVTLFANIRQLDYFTNNDSLITTLITSITILIFWWLTKIIKDQAMSNKAYTYFELEVVQFIYNINVAMLFLLPILPLSSEFGRMLRISWIYIYIILALAGQRQKDITIFNINLKAKWIGTIVGTLGFGIYIIYLSPLVISTIFY